jgi:hypothetical protein
VLPAERTVSAEPRRQDASGDLRRGDRSGHRQIGSNLDLEINPDLKKYAGTGVLMLPQERYEAVLQGARHLIDGDESRESALGYMRNAGLSQIECVKAIKSLTGGDLGWAKEIVHFSETWSDMRPHQEQLHSDLSDELSAE